MLVNNIKSIVFFILGGLIIFLLLRNCSGNHPSNEMHITTPDKTVIVKFTTKIDTVFVKKYIHRIDTIKVPYVVKADTVFIKGTKEVATMPKIRRVYQNTISPVDSVKVKYTAKVTGTLDTIALDYEDNRAIKTIIKTNTIETTITKHITPKGLYVGISSNIGLTTLTPTLAYVNNKNTFGVNYNMLGTLKGYPNIGISYSRKLF